MKSDTIDAINDLLTEGEGRFLELARRLRDAIDVEPGAVNAICNNTDLKKRRVYCLARIARTFDGMIDDDTRLTRIGWTKLDLIAPHVTVDNVEELLRLAEGHAPAVLSRLLVGAQSGKRTHTIQLTFGADDYALLCEAMVRAGARVKGRGHVGKEGAMVRIASDYCKNNPI